MAATPIAPKFVGARVRRREDPRLIRGRGTYVDDIKIPGMCHLAFKRSDVPHGRIRAIDVSAATAMSGVEAVFTGAQIDVNELAGRTLFTTCNSWYLGANVPGKARVFMPYLGTPAYERRCRAVAEDGYTGFRID